MFDYWLQYLSPQQFLDLQNFKKFLLDNNIIATTAGVLIAYSAWDFIQSFVGDLVLPGIFFLFIQRFITNGFVSSVFEPVNRLNLPKFIARLISFTVVILFTFLFIQYVIKNWLTDKALSSPDSQGNVPSPPIQGNTVVQGNVIVNELPRGLIQYSDFTLDSFQGHRYR
jgi:large-conductance mechanosensitive channel